eukprot:TRINITY_DN32928_c0_g1_i1.p1 TRINITY_DN32928_c0_g1~~TRINITY_DN32928_c0_g1_i1.p1  ORF type:complete len:531 (+),score=162.99 TRINITY_DN32928_c0_g1_i1:58-1593(+)
MGRDDGRQGEKRLREVSSSTESSRRRKKEKKRRKKEKKKRKKERKRRDSSSSDDEPLSRRVSLWDEAPQGVDAEAARRQLAEQLAAQRAAQIAAVSANPATPLPMGSFAGGSAASAALGLSPETKAARELYIGNLPTDPVPEDELRRFLNSAMEQAGLNTQPGDSIIACRVSGRFAFAEFRSVEECTTGLSLSGIQINGRGAPVSFSRPKRHEGKAAPHRTWAQTMAERVASNPELQGRVIGIEGGMAPAPEMAAQAGADMVQQKKVARELFIGGLPEGEVSESILIEFLNNVMSQKGLLKPDSPPGLPVVGARVTGRFAFVEFRDPYECSLALNLCGVPFGNGVQLQLKRPKAYTGPSTSAINWAALENGQPVPPPEPTLGSAHAIRAPPMRRPDPYAGAPPQGWWPPPAPAAAPENPQVSALKQQWVAAMREGDTTTAEQINASLQLHGVAPDHNWLTEGSAAPAQQQHPAAQYNQYQYNAYQAWGGQPGGYPVPPPQAQAPPPGASQW